MVYHCRFKDQQCLLIEMPVRDSDCPSETNDLLMQV